MSNYRVVFRDGRELDCGYVEYQHGGFVECITEEWHEGYASESYPREQIDHIERMRWLDE